MKQMDADQIDEEATEGPYDHLQQNIIEIAVRQNTIQNGRKTGVEGAEVQDPRSDRNIGGKLVRNPWVLGEDEVIVAQLIENLRSKGGDNQKKAHEERAYENGTRTPVPRPG
jgi:hypothetical protein